MVRKYVRKSQRQSWSKEDMKKAIEYTLAGGKVYEASIAFQVPRETLRRKLNLFRDSNDSDDFVFKTNLGFKSVFTKEEEDNLVNQIKDYESKLCGFTSTEVRALAYDFAEKLKKPHKFDNETKLAGLEWFRGFMRRYSTLALRKPEPTSAARATGFNRRAVNDYFDLLEDVYNKYHFTCDRIWNMDESGISCNPKSTLRIVSLKGKRQVGNKTSAERGENVTAVMCMSARGDYMPPLLIFPRVKENKEYLTDAPSNAWAEFNKSGWMENDVFTKWLQKFITFSRATKENPVLLLLDGHASHVKNLEAILLARENGVVMLCFPPHCTHRMQPLDVGYMKPLSNYYTSELNKWMRYNKGQLVRLKHIYSIFGKAYLKASQMETAVNSFRKTGIMPFDRHIFKDEDFVQSSDVNDPALDNTTVDLLGINQSNQTNRYSSDLSNENASNAFQESVAGEELAFDIHNLNCNTPNDQPTGNVAVYEKTVSNVENKFMDTSQKNVSIQEIAKRIKQELHHPVSKKTENNTSTVSPDIIIDLVTKSVQEVLINTFKSGDVTVPASDEIKTPAKPKRPRAKGKPVVVTSDAYSGELEEVKKTAKKPRKATTASKNKKVLSDVTNESFSQQTAIVNCIPQAQLNSTFVTVKNGLGQEVLLPILNSNIDSSIQSNQLLDENQVQYYIVN